MWLPAASIFDLSRFFLKFRAGDPIADVYCLNYF